MKAVLGYVGGCLLGAQLIPQIWKCIKTKSCNDISRSFLVMNIIGLLCMFIYGYMNDDPPIYVPTLVSGINSAILLILTFIYAKANPPSPLASFNKL